MSPRTPSSPDESASFHPRTAHERIFTFLRVRAPFRLLPIRAPRQTWLRTSFGLAPSRVVVSCDPTAWKARDASRRPLPPNRTACTRTSRVPGSVRQFPAGDPHGVLGSVRLLPGDRGVHDPRARFGGPSSTLLPCSTASRPGVTSVGVFFPRRR